MFGLVGFGSGCTGGSLSVDFFAGIVGKCLCALKCQSIALASNKKRKCGYMFLICIVAPPPN